MADKKDAPVAGGQRLQPAQRVRLALTRQGQRRNRRAGVGGQGETEHVDLVGRDKHDGIARAQAVAKERQQLLIVGGGHARLQARKAAGIERQLFAAGQGPGAHGGECLVEGVGGVKEDALGRGLAVFVGSEGVRIAHQHKIHVKQLVVGRLFAPVARQLAQPHLGEILVDRIQKVLFVHLVRIDQQPQVRHFLPGHRADGHCAARLPLRVDKGQHLRGNRIAGGRHAAGGVLDKEAVGEQVQRPPADLHA